MLPGMQTPGGSAQTQGKGLLRSVLKNLEGLNLGSSRTEDSLQSPRMGQGPAGARQGLSSNRLSN